MAYKWCVVPQCTNTSIKTPQTLFLSVPTNTKRRRKWLQLAGRDPNSIGAHSNIFMCEDHFDMEKDTTNYLKYKMGFSQKILIANEAMPSKFNCQQNRKRRRRTSRKVLVKRKRMEKESLLSHNITDTLQKDDNNWLEQVIKKKPEDLPKTKEKDTKKESPTMPCGELTTSTLQAQKHTQSVLTDFTEFTNEKITTCTCNSKQGDEQEHFGNDIQKFIDSNCSSCEAQTKKTDTSLDLLHNMINELVKQNTEIKDSIAIASKQYEDMKSRVDTLVSEKKVDHQYIHQLKERIDNLEHIVYSNKIEIKIEKLEDVIL